MPNLTATSRRTRCASSPPPSLFDGHDAAINIMRRILQARGAEVIHLGHNRSVAEIVDAAIQEDAQGIAVTSYQGGHIEFFKYMIDLLGSAAPATSGLRRRRRGHRAARDRGAARPTASPGSTRPRTAATMGLEGMIDDMLEPRDFDRERAARRPAPAGLGDRDHWLAVVAGRIYPESRTGPTFEAAPRPERRRRPCSASPAPAAPASRSLVDELVRRFLADFPARTDRHPVGRPDQAQDRRRPARRPHPHERHRHPTGSSCARWPPARPTARCPRTSTQSIASARRPGFDLVMVETSRHRPGRLGDRRHLRPVALRDDPRVRRSHPAREDRHARLRRLRRDQQVRPPAGAGRRCATSASSTVATRDLFDGPGRCELPVYATIASQFHDHGVNAPLPGHRGPARDRFGPPWTLDGTAAVPAARPTATPRSPATGPGTCATISHTVRSYKTWAEAPGPGRRTRLYQLVGARAILCRPRRRRPPRTCGTCSRRSRADGPGRAAARRDSTLRSGGIAHELDDDSRAADRGVARILRDYAARRVLLHRARPRDPRAADHARPWPAPRCPRFSRHDA